MNRIISTYLNIIMIAAAVSAVFILNSCSEYKSESITENTVSISSSWYRQAQVDLGTRIKMYSLSEGYAISRGRGEIEGRAYKFTGGKWVPFYSFPYSDFPQIIKNGEEIWTINHLVHKGFYKPVLHSFGSEKKELPLPLIKWDDTDFSMWKSIHVFDDRTALLAGQQGNLIYFNGNNWEQVESTINRDTLQNLLAGDINDLFMFDKNNGWAAGKDGMILRCVNGKWIRVNSPSKKHLLKIWMADENTGWIVGMNGTLLKYDGMNWQDENIEIPGNLNSIKGLNKNYVFAVGDNSTLLLFDGTKWHQDISIKNIEDSFQDVDIIEHNNEKHIWLMGAEGIYTNSKSIGFSFTDYTNQSGIRRTGTVGLFFKKNSDFQDLLILNEESIPTFYSNAGKGIFSEKIIEPLIENPIMEVYASSIGDINNDGEMDIFLLFYGNKFKLLLGNGNDFIDFSSESQLNFDEIDSHSYISARLVDLNNDGNLDLYIANFEKQDFYFINNGAGVFKKKIFNYLKPADGQRCLATVFADFNNDGFIDLFKAYQTAVNGKLFYLFLNKGNFVFEEKENPEFIDNAQTSIMTNSALAADFNNDGHSDILLMNQKSPPILFINDGTGSFKDCSAYAGFNEVIYHPEPFNGIANTADVNNDGYLDVFISSRLFLNSPELKFTDVSEQTGLNFLGNPSFADIDEDGDMDLFIGSSRRALGKGDRTALYKNNLNNKNFLTVNLNADKSNRAAAGTKLFLRGFNKDGKLIFNQKQEAGLNSSPYVQQNISQFHFGLPQAAKYELHVIFPSGKNRTFKVQPSDKLTIRESSLLQHLFINTYKSIVRTFLLIDLRTELIRFAIALILLVLIIFAGIKYKVKKLVLHPLYISFLILLYFIQIHLTVLNDLLFSSLVSFGIIPAAGGILILTARKISDKRKQQYISHYKILSLVGEGGMGKVYKAVDIHSKKITAVKILNSELLDDPENQKRFRSEGELLSAFNHPNIVKIYEAGQTEGKGFIAMEYLSGGTLNVYLKNNFPLSPEEMKRILLQICDGLIEIHKAGVVHRDVKTNNIMLDENNNIRIMDFGLSKSNLVSTMTSLGTVIGTLGYVAPEQITNVFVDQRTDIFSLGVVMFELTTNSLPFKGENEMALIHSIFNTIPPLPSSLNPELNKIYDSIIMKCMEKDINLRYTSVEELKNDLLNLDAVTINQNPGY